MAWGIHNVNPVLPVINVGALRQDSDPLFSLQLVAIQRAFSLQVHTSRAQQTVYQSGLAMVNVSNDGHIAGSLQKLLSVAGYLSHLAEPGSTGTEEGSSWNRREDPSESVDSPHIKNNSVCTKGTF